MKSHQTIEVYFDHLLRSYEKYSSHRLCYSKRIQIRSNLQKCLLYDLYFYLIQLCVRGGGFKLIYIFINIQLISVSYRKGLKHEEICFELRLFFYFLKPHETLNQWYFRTINLGPTKMISKSHHNSIEGLRRFHSIHMHEDRSRVPVV